MPIILLFTFLTIAATIIGDVACMHLFGLELHSITILIIVPLGAIFIGFFSSYGWYYGHMRVHKEVKVRELLVGMIIGATVLIGIYYVAYRTTYITADNQISHVSGEPMSNYEIDGVQITFFKYMQMMLSSGRWTLFHKAFSPDSGLETGFFVNFLFFLLQIGASAIGGMGGLTMLADKKYCQNCKKYSIEKKLYDISFKNHQQAIDDLTKQTENYSQLTLWVKQHALPDPKPKTYMQIQLRYCPDCYDGSLLVKVMKKDDKSKKYSEVRSLLRNIPISTSVSAFIAKNKEPQELPGYIV